MEASDSQPLPLILKVALDLEQVKRIRYSDSRQLSFAAFQQRISTVLQLSPHKQHSIIYDDDDGEQCEIACDDTLAEAIAYFTPSSGQVTSISMRVCVNLVSTLTLSDFGGSEMDDGESGVASSYWGSYRAPSASGGFSASGAAESNVQAASRLSGSSPFRSYQGSSELYRPSSISSSHLQQRSEGSSSNGRITSISHEQILASNGRESSSLSFLAPAPPLSQWGSSSLAHLGNTNGFDALPGDDFNEVRRRRNADILQRAAELRARSGRSPPSSQTTSHISGSQADSNHLPPPAASHSYHTQSQWDGMSSLSGSIGPGLFPVQELAAAAASQRNEAARAQVEKMERHIFEMQAILDMEKRKLREEEQWQLDVAAGAHSSPPTSHRGPSVGGSPDPNVSQSFGRQGKRTRMIRIDAPLDDSGDESEPESVQTISNFSVMPGRSTTAQSRLHAASTGGTHDLVPTAIDLAAKGFLPEDETALATMQQPPRPSPGVFVESAESVQSKSEGVQGEEQAGDGTLLIEDGKEKVQHPTCSTCKAHVEGDSLRYVCVPCGPQRLCRQERNDSSPSETSNTSRVEDRRGSGSGSGSGDTVLGSHSAGDRDPTMVNPGASSTDEWSSIPASSSPQAVQPLQQRGRTDSSGSSSSSSSSSSSNSSSQSSVLSARTQVSSSSSNPAPSPKSGSEGVVPSGHDTDPTADGFELCFACFQSNAAREHLQDPRFNHARSQIQIRTRSSTVPGPQHAFFELLWREDKWTPIEDELPVKCTHCVREDNWQTGRYKCSSCDDINLCGSCFKRVDDIHPPHVFLRMPVRAASIPSSSSSERRRSSAGNGRSMPPVHTGVECAACGQQPITGTRWHCASCLGGRDFCVRCEADEDIMAAQAEVAGHSLDHLLIKIAAPLDGNVVSKLGNSLIRAQQRLAAQAERAAAAGPQPGTWSESVDNLQNEWDAAASNGNASLSRQHQAMEQAWQTATTVTVRSTGEQKGAQCFNCQKSLHNGPRFICANCPLGQLTPGVLGLNLCEDCEKISQDLHDPSHFFIKIQRPRYGGGGAGAWTALNAHAIARLRARTGDDIEAPLLPILYKDARAIATGETLANFRAHVISTSIARRHDGSNEHQNGQDTDDEDEDVLRHVQVSIDSGSSGPSGPIQRTWPLRQPFATTLALARSGKLGKAYQKTLQSTIRSWVQNTKDEFEMYRLNLVSPRNSNPESPSASASASASASPMTALSNCARACDMIARASGWRWFEDIGTKNAAYVPIRDLVHPSILCDSCYECIEGVWYRCCSCKESFDLCSRCEGRVEHDSRHVFAVFKQPVDMALFKSLIDHAAEANGHSVSARPMLPVLLVGQDE
ncbi:hypothetical protein A4X06_0g803 [Tilletia controversa]|uniref:ZZ-type domain-containing protein n=1 Tax=Tilletia controversa TaxID=13291 RepID=A0A8X7T0E0_9BASI|nr:hypothetical protein CF328_g263 [Tilletia controversa]KAE8254642.1 hypothetical protein A4X06_0g803 [Tilletia controversa]